MVCLLKRLTDPHCDISINLLFLFVLSCFADYCTTSSCGPLWGSLDTINLWIYCSYFFLLPLFSRAQLFEGWLALTQNVRLNCNLVLFDCFVNPLIPESDQHLISPFNITHESNIKVMRIKEMIINWRTSWLLNKFSLQAHLENNVISPYNITPIHTFRSQEEGK